MIEELRSRLTRPCYDDADAAKLVAAAREAADRLAELEAEVAEWRQAAEVEASLRREFLARAEAAEAEVARLRAENARLRNPHWALGDQSVGVTGPPPAYSWPTKK